MNRASVIFSPELKLTNQKYFTDCYIQTVSVESLSTTKKFK